MRYTVMICFLVWFWTGKITNIMPMVGTNVRFFTTTKMSHTFCQKHQQSLAYHRWAASAGRKKERLCLWHL